MYIKIYKESSPDRAHFRRVLQFANLCEQYDCYLVSDLYFYHYFQEQKKAGREMWRLFEKVTGKLGKSFL